MMMAERKQHFHRFEQVCWGLLWVLLLFLVPPANAADKYQKMINCDLHNAMCRQELADKIITLEVFPRPVTAMTDLTFKVHYSGQVPSDAAMPYIDLGMPGMNMGPNRVSLIPKANGAYEGKGVIVKCPSGRRTWQATVTIPEVGVTTFIFDVVY